MPFMIGSGFYSSSGLLTVWPATWQANANFRGAGLAVPSGTIQQWQSVFRPLQLNPISLVQG